MNTGRRAFQAGLLALTLAGVFLLGTNAEAWCPFGGVEAIYTYLSRRQPALFAGHIQLLCLRGGDPGSPSLAPRVLRVHVPDRYDLRMARGCQPSIRPADVSSSGEAGPRVVARQVRGSGGNPGGDMAAGRIGLSGLLPRLRSAQPTRGRHYLLGLRGCGSDGSSLTAYHDAVLPLVLPAGGSSESALSHLASARIKRDAAGCSNCGRCTASCPMAIPVDRLRQVTASRCLACMECVEACPEQRAASAFLGTAGLAGARMAPGGGHRDPARMRRGGRGCRVLGTAAFVREKSRRAT